MISCDGHCWCWLMEGLLLNINLLQAELDAHHRAECIWRENNGVYITACGHMFQFTEGGIGENGAVYCQYCGGKINQAHEGAEDRP